MKGKDLFDKMTSIDNDLIEDAVKAKAYKDKQMKKLRMRWIAAAACICVITAGGIFAKSLMNNDAGDTALQNQSDRDGDMKGNNSVDIKQGEAVETDPMDQQPGKDSKVFVPKLELPKVEAGTQLDMIGLVVYKGNIYTNAQMYDGDEAEAVKSLVGEYVGTAKGNIDEWSEQDDYAKELASSVPGEVYTVKGYDDSFRLCMTGYWEDEDGKKIDYVHFYENLNGIGLNTGSDLFNDRLKLIVNWKEVKYQEHDNWNEGWPDYEYKDMNGITTDDINEFLSELSSSEFVNKERSSIYDGDSHHLFFHLNDGTCIELRLFEGGYVGYQPLGWYFVKMDGEAFNKIYEASE